MINRIKRLKQGYTVSTFVQQLCLFAFVLLLGACSEEVLVRNNDNNGGDVTLQLSVITSDATPPKATTRLGQLTNESAIAQVQILVFENDSYQYRVQGTGLVSGGSHNTTFTAKLTSSNAPVSLYIIANADALVNANEPQVGETMAMVKTRFNTAFTTTGVNSNFTMWGTYVFESGLSPTNNNTVTGIRMLRSLARVDITATNVASNFQMTSIQAFRVANKSQIIPTSPTSAPGVSTPSIPANTDYTVNTIPLVTTATGSSAQLYLPESEAPDPANIISSATCVVVGGYYDGSPSVTYYRLDFNPSIGGHPLGQILRNHRYEFNLRYVGREGYATPEEAANNPSSAMQADMILWQDYIKYMVYDSQNYFGVSAYQVRLNGTANATADILVETDTPAYTLTWADRNGVPLPGETASQSLNDGVFQLSKSPDGSILSVTALTINPIGSPDRVNYVLVRIGNLRMLLTVIQEADNFTPGGVKWADGNVDLPGTFAPMGDVGMFYQWNRRVAWPSVGTVTGWNGAGADGFLWEEANDPCPTGWRVPTEAELRALITSPGVRWRSGEGYPNDGVWFAPTQGEADAATLETPGSAIFFPIGGGRDGSGLLYNAGSNGYYWTGDLDIAANPNILSIASGTYFIYASDYRAFGFLVRCVQE